MIGRSQLMAWGAAGVVHVLMFAVSASIGFDRRLEPIEPELIELAIILPPPPQAPEPALPDLRPALTDPPPVETKPKVETPVTAIITRPSPDGDTAPPPRKVTRRTVGRGPSAPAVQQGPYRETPPGPVQQTLRAFQCARLSPSQRRLCPTNELEDEFISVMVADARGAQPIYDPVLNVYKTRTLLDRLGGGAPQAGMFSGSDNASTLVSSNTGDAATSGMSTLLNSNPDPAFDGVRDPNWNSDAGRPRN